MKGFIILFVIFLSLIACEEAPKIKETTNPNSTKKNALPPNPIHPTLQKLVNAKTTWLKYYKMKDASFDPRQFESAGKETLELSPGNAWNDTDPNFEKTLSALLINAPDHSQYIDLDSYWMELEKEADKIISYSLDLDQEVNWVNRKTKEAYRIGFCGSACEFEDAVWLDNQSFVLMGKEEDKLFLQFIELNKKETELYYYPNPLNSKENYNYSKDIRYKALPLVDKK
ncbi:hypothetical protein [Aureispira anguillae]|uniref:Uncharacterized protein n=1 Tax=Aureispira anguillae TaxID=2864201 RepID=A0A915YC89_9BACT|nr:hypothetical protein [Aureispira anguillae]BDS10399.1 hypothetical protein AsAng_0011070 [Aureispira anguillae]